MERLSIIIPSYNRTDLTIKSVEESMKGSYMPDEIIVVNDGGDPSLKDRLVNLPKKTKLIYTRVTEDILWNYNGACNLGFWISTGDYFILQDCDHIPDRDAYKNGIEIMKNNKDISRVAYRRKVVNVEEVMSSPMENWNTIKVWGTNQMVTMLKRDVYLKMKGQDERFVRKYGYMAMDFKCRRDNILKFKTMTTNHFWAVVGDGGEPNLIRGMHPDNRKLYRENSLRKDGQHPLGILNFNYEYEVL